MTRISSLPLLSCIALASIFLVLSCASSNPQGRLTVRVPQGVTGSIRVNTCASSSSSADITVDNRGNGSTSLCPPQDTPVEVTIVRGSQTYTLAAPDVTVVRTGDGISTSIMARLRP